MVALKMLLPDSRYQIYHRQIEGLFDELTSNLSTITVKKIQRIMGMPNNWKRLKKIFIGLCVFWGNIWGNIL